MNKICFVIPSLSMGGTERQLTHLLQGLARDYETMLVCTHHDGTLAGDARRDGARVYTLGTRGGWDMRQRWTLEKIFRSHRPDIVHTFLFGFDLFANMAARSAGVPAVVSSRRELPLWMKRRHWMMQRLADRYVDCVVANSQAAAKFAQENEAIEPRRLRVIYNGIEANAFISTTDTRVIRERFRAPFHRHIIGMVANFSPVKDHELFLDVAAELLQRRADLHFLLVGQGPLEKAIRARVSRLKISDCVTIASSVVEMPDLYAIMDVSVLCSKVEGFPNALLESMAAGRPVVAPKVGGIPEMIRHGETGLLVEQRNAGAFADEIGQVLDHPEESNQMGKCAAAHVRREFTIEKMIDNYRRLYTELLEKKRR